MGLVQSMSPMERLEPGAESFECGEWRVECGVIGNAVILSERSESKDPRSVKRNAPKAVGTMMVAEDAYKAKPQVP